MKKLIVLILLLVVSSFSKAQTLIINEVSNGPTGAQEYVEFVVVDSTVIYDCTGFAPPPCVDIRGWIYDDNTGYHGTSGIAQGAARFTNDPLWACVPVGTIILLYNGIDPNPDVPVDDVSSTDGNCSITVSLDNPQFFEFTETTPGDIACNYPTTGWGLDPSPNWANVAMANGGDCARLVDLNGCEVFSLCYGAANLNPMIYFNSGGSGTDNNWSFGGVDPYAQANWTEGCAGDINACGSNDQTPGAPNNAANAAYIGQFNNYCSPIPPIVADSVVVAATCGCSGMAIINAVGSIPGYTYEWYNSVWTTIGVTNDTAFNLCPGTYYAIATSSIGCEDTISAIITAPITMTLTDTTTNPLCFGACDGTATLTVSGGALPLTYSWDNSASTTNVAADLCVGMHIVTITDFNGCTIYDTIILTEPPVLTVITTFINPLCFGSSDGSVNSTITGGTPPYSYLWDDAMISTTQNVTNLPFGTYNILVTDSNSCVQTIPTTLIQPTQIIAAPTGVNPLCFGSSDGTVTLVVSGGMPTYTYLWDDALASTTQNISGLPDGAYNVTVTDLNNCVQTAQVILTQPTQLAVTPTGTNPLCFGSLDGTVTLVVSGATPTYTYLWDDALTSTTQNISSLPNGTYNVTVTDLNNCVQTGQVTLAQPTQILVVPTGINPLCFASADGSVTLAMSGGTAPYTYLWDDPAVSTTQNVSGLVNGTYNVTIADLNNCVATVQMTLTEPTPIVAVPTGVNPLCFGSSDGSIVLAVSGGTAPYSYLWDDALTSTTQNVIGLPDGTYNVTVTDFNNCTQTAQVLLNHPTQITASIVGTNPLCFGSSDASAILTSSGGTGAHTFLWDDINASTTQSLMNVSGGTYSVMVMDANNCIQNAMVVLIEPTDIIVTTFDTNPLCFGAVDGGVNLSVSGGTPAYSFLWGNASIGQALTNVGAGTYTVQVTDINNCVQIATTTLVEPTAIAITQNIVGANCGTNDGQACISISGGTSPYTQSWNDPNSQISLCANNLYAGSYQVDVLDNNNCLQSFPVLVSNITPNITITPLTIDLTCNAYSNGAVNLAVVSPNTYTMDWVGPNAFTAAGDQIANLAAGTYTYTFTDVNSCIIINSVEVVEPTVLVLSVITDSASCEVVCDGVITASSIGGTVPYQWSLDNVNFGAGAFPNLCDGAYTVYTSDINGCMDSLNVSIFPILFQANATVAPVAPMCANVASIQLVAAEPGGVWSGMGITNSVTGIFDPAVAGVGTFPITYMIPGACGDTSVISIDVLLADNVVINQPPAVCADAIDFNLTVQNIGGQWNGIGITDNVLGTFSPAISGAGVFTVYYNTVSTCPDLDSVNVTILPIITPIINPQIDMCINDGVVTLTADVTGGIWTGSGISNSTTGAFNPTFGNIGGNEVIYTVSALCGSTDTIQIIVNDLPQANIILSDTIGCIPLSVNFSNSVFGNNVSCIWDLGDGTQLDNCNSFDYLFDTEGCFDISLTITNQAGCSDNFVASSPVCTEATPISEFSYFPTAPTEYDGTVDFTNESQNGVSYEWLLNNSFYTTDYDTDYNFEGIGPGTYPMCLITTNSLNCVDTICKDIIVAEEFALYVPNAFTPNGDGDNDGFKAVLSGPTPDEFTMYIFNRWGQLLFESNSHFSAWDGYYKGVLSQQDVYIWKIVYRYADSAKRKELIGHVSLLK